MFNCKKLFKLQIRPTSLILLISTSQDRWIFPSQSWEVRNSIIMIKIIIIIIIIILRGFFFNQTYTRLRLLTPLLLWISNLCFSVMPPIKGAHSYYHSYQCSFIIMLFSPPAVPRLLACFFSPSSSYMKHLPNCVNCESLQHSFNFLLALSVIVRYFLFRNGCLHLCVL